MCPEKQQKLVKAQVGALSPWDSGCAVPFPPQDSVSATTPLTMGASDDILAMEYDWATKKHKVNLYVNTRRNIHDVLLSEWNQHMSIITGILQKKSQHLHVHICLCKKKKMHENRHRVSDNNSFCGWGDRMKGACWFYYGPRQIRQAGPYRALMSLYLAT